MVNEIQKAPELSQTQIDLIKRTVAKGATNDELALFLHQATKAGLDPLARQIHYIKRGGQGSIQVGIDGYRLIADRTGRYAGNDAPEFDWADSPVGDEHPLSATVTVYKLVGPEFLRCAFSATADWDFFAPEGKGAFMWERGSGKFMLAKCAEALALRKAFPAELSGMYTHEEMAQAGGNPEPAPDNGNGDRPPADDEDTDALLQEETDALIEQIGAITDLKALGDWKKLKRAKIAPLDKSFKDQINEAYNKREAELKQGDLPI
jgi:phage recombination protein Bet